MDSFFNKIQFYSPYFSDLEDPFHPILEYLSNDFQFTESNNSVIVRIRSCFSIPSFSVNEIKNIHELGDGFSYYMNYCKSIGFNSPFDFESLDRITQVTKLTDNETEFLVRFIFTMYISWLIYFGTEKSCHYLPLLLEAVIHLLSFRKDDILINIFIFSLAIYRSAKSFNAFTSMISSITQFLDKSYSESPKLYDIIFSFLDEFIINIDDMIEHSRVYITFIKWASIEKDLNIDIDKVNHFADILVRHGNLTFDEENSLDSSRVYIKVELICLVLFLFSKNCHNRFVSGDALYPRFSPLKKSYNVVLHYTGKNTFSNGFRIIPSFKEASLLDFSAYFPESVLSFVESVNLSISSSNDYIRSVFFPELYNYSSRIGDSFSKIPFDSLVLLILFKSLMTLKSIPSSTQFFSDLFVFRPAYFSSYFTNLRFIAFRLVLLRGEIDMLDLIESTSSTPALPCEFMNFILKNLEIVYSPDYLSCHFAKSISKFLLYLQELNFCGEEIEDYRIKVFSFLHCILNNISVSEIMFSDPYFSSTFLSFVFEYPLRSFVLQEVLVFMINTSNNIQVQIVSNIINIITLSQPSISQEYYSILVVDILKCIIQILDKQPNHGLMFSELCDTIFYIFDSLSPSNLSKEIIVNSVMFFSQISSVYSLPQLQYHRLSITIDNIFENSICDSLFQILINLVKGKSNDCLIAEPDAAVTILRIYKDEDHIIRICCLLNDMCRISPLNCQKCHDFEIDLQIIELLLNKWSDDQTSECLVEVIMKLFSRIAIVSSSSVVVLRYLTLLSPISENRFSKHFSLVMSTLIEQLELLRKEPNSCCLFTISNVMKPMSNIQIDNGVSILFWVFLSSNHNEIPQLFCISASDFSIILVIKNGVSQIMVNNNSGIILVTELHRIPEDIWSFNSFSFLKSDKVVSLLHRCDDLVYTTQLPITSDLFTGQGSFSFGGCNDLNYSESSQSYLGPFGMFTLLSNEEIKNIYNRGYQLLGNVNPRPKYIAQYFNQSFPRKTNFPTLLLLQCNLTSIFPLISFPSQQSYFNGKTKNILSILCDIVSISIQCGEDIQNHFVYIHIFELFHYLLSTISIDYLSFELYEQFYNMLTNISILELSKLLIMNILFNFQLWAPLPSSIQCKIHNHWLSVLFPNYASVLVKCYTFSTVFLYTQILYYTNCKNTDLVRKAPNNTDLSCLHSVLNQIMVYFSSYSFPFDDFLTLISFCKSSSDPLTIVYILRLMQQMAKATPSPFFLISKDPQFLILILDFITFDNYSVVLSAIELIVTFFSSHLVNKPSITTVVYFMINNIPKNLIDLLFFKSILEMNVTISKELYPLSCYIAYQLGPEAVRLLYNTHPAFTKDSYVTFWEVYTIMLISRAQNDSLVSLLKFLSKGYHESLVTIFTSIEILSGFFGTNKDNLQSIIINSLTELIHNGDIVIEGEGFQQYCNLLKFFLFFRPENYNNKALLCGFQVMPLDSDMIAYISTFFQTNINQRELNFSESEQFSMRAFFDYISDFKDPSVIYRFGLRMDANGNWLDEKLAKLSYLILSKHHTVPTLITSLLILYFLSRVDPSFVKDNIGQLVLPTNPSFIAQIFIDLLCFELREKKIKTSFINKGSINMFQNASEALKLYGSNCNLSYSTEKYISGLTSEIKAFKEFDQQNSSLITKIDPNRSIVLTEKLISDTKVFYTQFARVWRHIWGYLTIEKAPWANAVINKRHFKRDQTVCFSWCPMKLKPNWEYSDHSEASLSRDRNQGREPSTIKSKSQNKIFVSDIEDIITNNKILFNTTCQVVKVSHALNAKVFVTTNSLILKTENSFQKSYLFNDILYVFDRYSLHISNSCEVFLCSGKPIMLTFSSSDNRDKFCKIVRSKTKHYVQVLQGFGTIQDITNMWTNRKISTFEYLMNLNIISGRSFSDPKQYPIFPWVIFDFTTKELNLADPTIYRDFSKPVGAINSSRLESLKDLNSVVMNSPYLYENAMGCSLTLFNFLIRIEPFTSLHIEMQSGRFDNPQRIFYSINSLVESVTTNANDYRELIPEFFFSPEIFLNFNDFNLGTNEISPNGNVILPQWAKSAIEFVYLHRKALESPIVSASIHHWIDLVWGYKQKGVESIKSDNMFNPMLYEDIWTQENLNNPTLKQQIEVSKTFLGQIPPQILKSPHPQRIPLIETTGLSVQIKTGHTDIVFAAVESTKKNEFTVLMLDQIGVLYRLSWRICDSDDTSTSSVDNDPHSTSISAFDSSWLSSTFALLPNQSIFVTGPKTFLYNTTNSKIIHLCDSLQCYSVNNDWFAFVTSSSILQVFNARDIRKPISQTPFQRDNARCCAISPTFHVVCVCSRDGCIVVHSLETALAIRVIDLGPCTPQNVIVTPAWGFIVVYLTRVIDGKTANFISVHTINGIFVRETKAPCPVSKLTSWKSHDGFDFIAVSSDRGAIMVAEVFYLEFSKPEIRTMAQPLSLDYIESADTLISVVNNGKIFFKRLY